MKKLRTIVLSAAVLLTSSLGWAQGGGSSSFEPQHEFRLGIGALPIVLYSSQQFWENNNPWFWSDTGNPGEMYENQLIYRGDMVEIGSISAGYAYSFPRLVDLGVTLTYNGRYTNIYDRFSDAKIGYRRDHNLFATPMVRFNWLKRPYFRLYSQLGLGLGSRITSEKNTPKKQSSPEFALSGQVTFVGFSVGKDVFFYGEVLGVGNQGFAVAGVGFRFNAK